MVVGGVLGLGGGVAVLFCGEEDVGFAVDDECGVGVDECFDGEFVVFGAEVVVEYFEEYVFSSGFWALRASSMSRFAMEISAWARVMLWLRADIWALVALLLVFMVFSVVVFVFDCQLKTKFFILSN